MRANIFPIVNNALMVHQVTLNNLNTNPLFNIPEVTNLGLSKFKNTKIPELLFITSYPPRECGIATYTQDLRNAIQEKFGKSFSLKICALNANETEYNYSDEVKYSINTQEKKQFVELAKKINQDKNIAMIFLQHEFGLFGGDNGNFLLKFMTHLKRPITTTFHTVLPNPDTLLKKVVRKIVDCSDSVVVIPIKNKKI